MIDLSARAPVPRTIALCAIASSGAVPKTNLTLEVQSEELLVLLDERVLRFDEYAYDVLLVEAVQRHGDRQPADELGDEPVLEEILRPEVLEDVRAVLLVSDLGGRHM